MANHRFCYLKSIILAFIICCTSIACQEKQAEKKDERPNIIVIMTDDHTRQATSIYDSSLIQTPNMDRIGAEGIVFENAFVTNSICAPSRAVLLTGKYSHKNGLRDNHDSFDTSQVIFPKLLRKAGYYAAIVGKWHLKVLPTGFDYFNLLPSQGFYYNPDMIKNGDTIQYEGYTTNVITDIALDVLQNRDTNKPFCMMIQHKAPHRNWMPDTKHLDLFNDDIPVPDTYFDDYSTRGSAVDSSDMQVSEMWYGHDLKLRPEFFEQEEGSGGLAKFDPGQAWEAIYSRMTDAQKKDWDAHYNSIGEAFKKSSFSEKELALWKYQRYMKDYLRCVVSVDENVGRVLDYLDAEGLAENTLVIYTSDQGFYLGEHGWYDKRFMYEESFSTPLLMRFPNKMGKGKRTSSFAVNVDIAPTILDVAGVSIPGEMQGESLTPFFKNEIVQDWRSSVYYHYYQSTGWHNVPKHRGVRTDDFKLMHFYELDEWELYDLQNDPKELNNLYGKPQYESQILELKEELTRLRAQYDDLD